MRVIVLGGLGFVGRRLVEDMVKQSNSSTVIIVDAGWFAASEPMLQNPPSVYLKKTDIRDIGEGFFLPGDIVVNLAAVSNDAMGQRFDEVTQMINHLEAVRIARLARKGGASTYIFASSASVYGITGAGPASESSECQPQTSYALSKRNAESDLSDLARDDFSIYCFRFATACGWSGNVRTDLAINDFAASAIANGRVVLNSNGKARRPFISVQDMARSIAWVVANPRNGGPFHILNVGHNSWNMRIIDVAERVGDFFGVPVEIAPTAGPDTRDYELDFAAWQKFYGDWKPQASLEEILVELEAGFQKILNSGASLYSPGRVRLDGLSGLVSAGKMSTELEWT